MLTALCCVCGSEHDVSLEVGMGTSVIPVGEASARLWPLQCWGPVSLGLVRYVSVTDSKIEIWSNPTLFTKSVGYLKIGSCQIRNCCFGPPSPRLTRMASSGGGGLGGGVSSSPSPVLAPQPEPSMVRPSRLPLLIAVSSSPAPVSAVTLSFKPVHSSQPAAA